MKIIYFILITTTCTLCKQKVVKSEASYQNEVKQENSTNAVIKIDSLNKMTNRNLYSVLEKQILAGESIQEIGLDPFSNYKYGNADFNACTEVILDILKSNAYKKEDNFSSIIQKVFNIKPLKKIQSILLDNNCAPSNTLYQTSSDGSGIMSSSRPIQIDNENHFISEAYFLPELFDYQKKYPDILKVEKQLSSNVTIEGIEYKVNQWKDVKGLIQLRNRYVLTLVNRNKYIFNNNRASFVWLQVNDIDFLQSLVKVYGYVEDKDLSKFILDKSLGNYEEMSRVLWNKDCDDKLRFNVEIMDIIKLAAPKEQEKYLSKIVAFFEHVLINNANGKTTDEDLTFTQKAEMLGKLAYYATKISTPQGNFYYKFFQFLSNGKYEKEFENQHYYNIKDFKQIYEETKTGGVRLPM
jgi:hypothetical protein